MKQYKALIVDLDGTTVHHMAHEATKRVEEAVHKAHDQLFVCIATGRLLKHTLPIIEQLRINGPCVINNGCQIYDPVSKKVVSEVLLDRSIAAPIITILSKYSDTIIVSDGEKELPAKEWESLSKIMNFFISDISEESIAKIQDEITSIPEITSNKMSGYTSNTHSIEIIGAKGTKQYGIYEIAKVLGIQTADIIGIGDGYNDFPLMMACGLKIAMGNAVSDLKTIADFVCPTVDNDGVAVVIEKLILPA